MKRVRLFGDPLCVREAQRYSERNAYARKLLSRPTVENYKLALRTFVWTARRALIVALNVQDADTAIVLWRIDSVQGLIDFSVSKYDSMLLSIVDVKTQGREQVFWIKAPTSEQLSDPLWLKNSIDEILKATERLQSCTWGRTRIGKSYNGKDIFRKLHGFEFLERNPPSVSDCLCDIMPL